jgi:hypothetical protein
MPARKEEQGFTLIQVIISMAIMTILCLGIFQAINRAGKESSFLNSRLGNSGLIQEIRSGMAHSELCRKMFEGQTLSPSGNEGLSIRLPGSNTVLRSEMDLPRYGIHMKRIYSTPALFAGTTPRGTRLLRANIILESSTFARGKEKSRSFKSQQVGTLVAEVTAENLITDCSTLESELDLLRVACEQFGGSLNPTTRECDLAQGLCGKMGGQWVAGPPASCQLEGKSCAAPSVGRFGRPRRNAPTSYPEGGVTTTSDNWTSCKKLCVNGQWISISCTEREHSCFVSGTMIRMANGSLKPIEKVRPGDMVSSASGTSRVAGVERPYLGGRLLYRLNGGRAFVTAEHPFWTRQGWKAIDPGAALEENPRLGPLGPLKVKDRLLRDGQWVTLSSIEKVKAAPDTPLYNLILEGDHTYFADGYLVHNKAGEAD